mgnify:CR=1 FL=1
MVGLVLSDHRLPLGPEKGFVLNALFVGLLIAVIMVPIWLYQRHYARILGWCLDHKRTFLVVPAAGVLLGSFIWLGFPRVVGFVPAGREAVGVAPEHVTSLRPWVWARHAFPGLGKEFMPDLDEGSFLYMPTTMPHASVEEAQDVLRKLDQAIYAIPEVESVVGKIGRVESALDPAPISMVETVINYAPEYVVDQDGHRLEFRYDRDRGDYVRDAEGNLSPDRRGRPCTPHHIPVPLLCDRRSEWKRHL